MTIRIDKAMRIHESQVLRLVVGGASRGEGFRDQIIDFLAAVTTEADQDLHRLGRIANGLGGEFAELRMRQQHDGDCLADDDASGRVATELRIV